MGLQEIKRDGYNQTNVTTWLQIVVVFAVHLAINFIHKGRHQQKKKIWICKEKLCREYKLK